jgi:cell filamentation protein, protein adenylyltransferase
MSDPYLDPISGILTNKFGLHSQASLDRAEADAVALRSILLQGNSLKGNFDSHHLKQIHQYLFQDVYEWAGQFRTISMVKADYVDAARVTRFTPHEMIEQELTTVFQNLARDGFLKGLPRKEFAHKMAMLFAEINKIHPFREGNGRAQRQFVRQLSNSVGYKLHFEVVSKERLVQASILSANGDVEMMVRMMDEITDTERIQSLAKVIDHLKRNDFNWNDIYIATTTVGQQYAGTFAGTDGNNFFFRTEQNQLFVGKLSDLNQTAEPGEKIIFTAQ